MTFAQTHADTPFDSISRFDLDTAKVAYDRAGIAIIADVLLADEIEAVRQAADELIARDQEAGNQITGFAYDPDDRNIRLIDLVPRHQVFRALAEHPLALYFAAYALGPEFRLSNFSGNKTGPGSGRMYMHADQGFLPAPWPPYPMAVNIGWALDDFTFENGATLCVPGTHLKGHGPDPDGVYADAVPILCKAGSIFVMDGRTWHQTGANITQDAHRLGLFAYYVRPFILPQRPWSDLIPAADRAGLSDGLKRLLGLDVTRATTSLASHSIKPER